VVNLRKEVVG
jgi:uncharacterized protein (DUF3084 family)